jgi:hypothetical protein
LEHPTIAFNDQTLTLTEEVRPSAAATRGRGRGRGTFGLSHSRKPEVPTSPPSSPEEVKGTPRGQRGGRARGRGKLGGGGSRAGIGMKSRKMETDADYDDTEMNDRESAGPGAPAAAITDRTPKSQADFRQMLGL